MKWEASLFRNDCQRYSPSNFYFNQLRWKDTREGEETEAKDPLIFGWSRISWQSPESRTKVKNMTKRIKYETIVCNDVIESKPFFENTIIPK
jgi:hypothetical protein